jgi:hypothetical protein
MSTLTQPEYLTLQQWAAKKFSKPPHVNTLRRWAKDGMIVPQPILFGREYHVKPDARYIAEPAPGSRLVDRLKHGIQAT